MFNKINLKIKLFTRDATVIPTVEQVSRNGTVVFATYEVALTLVIVVAISLAMAAWIIGGAAIIIFSTTCYAIGCNFIELTQ